MNELKFVIYGMILTVALNILKLKLQKTKLVKFPRMPKYARVTNALVSEGSMI